MISFSFMMIYGILTDMLFSVGYIAYPAYATFKTINQKTTDQKTTDQKTTQLANLKQWSIYWVIYGLFNFIESYLPLYYHIPYYKFVKLFVLVFGFMDLPGKYKNYSLKFSDKVLKLYTEYESVFDEIAGKFGIEYPVLNLASSSYTNTSVPTSAPISTPITKILLTEDN